MRCVVCRDFSERKDPRITFHKFPKDHARRQAWLHSIGKLTFNLIDADVVCCRHFRQADFIYKVTKGNGRVRARLNASAVPYINAECSDDIIDIACGIKPKSKIPSTSAVCKKRKKNKIVVPSTSADCKKTPMVCDRVINEGEPLESVSVNKNNIVANALQNSAEKFNNVGISKGICIISDVLLKVNANDSLPPKPVLLSRVVRTTGETAKTENLCPVAEIIEQKQGIDRKKPKYVCEVLDCNRDSRRYPTISFHSFPSDAFKRSIWIDFCGRESGWHPQLNSKVCSVHFHTDDYEILKSTTSLKSTACPSMYVESIEPENDNNMKRTADTVQVEKNILEKEVVERGKTSYDIRCSVLNCKNDYATKGDTVQFHKFPISPTRRKIWARFCLRDDKWKPNSLSRVCSEHFELDDYLKSNLDPLRAKLKESACPSKYNICNEPESKKRRIEPVAALLTSSDEEDYNNSVDTPTNEIVTGHYDLIDNDKQNLIKENAELKATIAKLLKCNEILNANIESQLSYIETMENMCEEKNQKIKELEDLLKDLEEIPTQGSAKIEIPDVQPSLVPITDCKILKIATICRFCNKEFPSNTTLGAHMRKMHIKHLPFKCHLCVRCFANQAELNRHLKKHPGMKMFACSVCKDRFEEWSDLQEHLLEQHNKVAKFFKNAKNDDEATKTGANYGIIFVEKKSRGNIVSGDDESEVDHVQKNIMKMRCNDVMGNSSIDET